MSDLWKYIAALLPSSGLLYLFYVVLKHMIEADRRERAAVAKWEAENGPRSADEDLRDERTPDQDRQNDGHRSARRSDPTHGIPER